MDEASTNRAARYGEEELDALKAHIRAQFGEFDTVLRETGSPDFAVDVAVIYPAGERDHYTLITLGMGARPMAMPEALRDKQLARAELLVCLPPDWKLTTDDETWFWPIRKLKDLARLPAGQDTWLSWGHTVSSVRPFPGTRFTGLMLTSPGTFAPEAAECPLPGGEVVNFYQMLPLYDEELRFKVAHGAGALLERMQREMLACVRIDRPNACEPRPRKQYKLRPDDIKPLIQWEGPSGCMATDRITVDGCRVGYLYREQPDPGVPDCGWRFCAGDESQEYMDDPANTGIFALNTICNYDPDIVELLDAPYGAAFYRDESGVFRRDDGRE